MRWLQIGFLLLACILPLAAEDWTTADGHVYHNVTVVGQDNDGVRITYDGGVGKIPYYLLPVDIQKKFGQDVDSLAAKKRAIDKAIEAAVKAAADAQITAAPTITQTAPGYAPQPGNAPASGGYTTTTAPGNAPGGANPANPNAVPAPGAQTNALPHPAVVAHVATNAPPENPAEVAPPPVSHTPNPGVNGVGGRPLQLTVSNYSYNESLDACYLDSPPIDVFLVSGVKVSTTPGSSLTLRVVTDGRTPQAPDRFEMTFVCLGANASDLAADSIVFNTDSGTIAVPETDKKDSGSVPGTQAAYVSFYLSAEQVRQFSKSKLQTFNVGAYSFRLDDRGAAELRSYLADVDTLEPASSSLMHSIYKMLARIPSFFSIISTICEYVILGSFGLLLMASIAAFILGITRFIKM